MVTEEDEGMDKEVCWVSEGCRTREPDRLQGLWSERDLSSESFLTGDGDRRSCQGFIDHFPFGYGKAILEQRSR